MKKSMLALAVLALSLLAAGAALADARYTDPAGDSGGAPDITAVTAANDAAGNITFTVATNQPALAGDAALAIVFDTDMNSSTGGNGAEFLLVANSRGLEFRRYDGSQFVNAGAASASMSYANGLLTFKVNKSDLGNVGSFVFYAFTLQFDSSGEVVAADDAPDGTGVYLYVLTTPPPPPPPPPLTLRASAPFAVPVKPAAGKAFSVRVGVTRGDTNAPLAAGVATCKVTVGLKPLRAVGTVRAGKASCSMIVPKTAHGKMLRGTIKVTFKNVSVTKSFAYRVP